MNTEEMFQEVDRRVSDSLLEHLLPKAIDRHAKSKKHFRNCDCNYCRMKKEATTNIANFSFPSHYDTKHNSGPLCTHGYEFWEIKAIRRANLREHYREKLKELIDD